MAHTLRNRRRNPNEKLEAKRFRHRRQFPPLTGVRSRETPGAPGCGSGLRRGGSRTWLAPRGRRCAQASAGLRGRFGESGWNGLPGSGTAGQSQERADRRVRDQAPVTRTHLRPGRAPPSLAPAVFCWERFRSGTPSFRAAADVEQGALHASGAGAVRPYRLGLSDGPIQGHGDRALDVAALSVVPPLNRLPAGLHLAVSIVAYRIPMISTLATGPPGPACATVRAARPATGRLCGTRCGARRVHCRWRPRAGWPPARTGKPPRPPNVRPVRGTGASCTKHDRWEDRLQEPLFGSRILFLERIYILNMSISWSIILIP